MRYFKSCVAKAPYPYLRLNRRIIYLYATAPIFRLATTTPTTSLIQPVHGELFQQNATGRG